VSAQYGACRAMTVGRSGLSPSLGGLVQGSIPAGGGLSIVLCSCCNISAACLLRTCPVLYGCLTWPSKSGWPILLSSACS